MNYQMVVSSYMQPNTPKPEPVNENTELLRQILEVQKQQLALAQAAAAAHDTTSRWKAFLNRWHNDFADLASACRQILPQLERAYGTLLSDLTEHLQEHGAPDNDFALQEFLDRYGMRLAQLGTILSLVGPLAEVAAQEETAGEQKRQ
ncbi:MAG: hypothetical protein KatS3mg105_2812 [Gemmatales bacterium]|nr:MAG: hypothetical protein KatS3mg105_2812 [Gemmatales bacterium]